MPDATQIKPPMMVLHQLCGSARVCFLPGRVARPLSYIVARLIATWKSLLRWRLHWKSSQSSGETLQAPLIASQSVTSPILIACQALWAQTAQVSSASLHYFWFNLVADGRRSSLEYFHTLSFSLTFSEETGQMGESTAIPWTRQTGQNYGCTCSFHSWLGCVWSCELQSTDSLSCDRLVSELYLTLWTSLHIAMTSVIVFKRGCIFMCNSFCRNHVCQWWSQWLVRSFYNTW